MAKWYCGGFDSFLSGRINVSSRREICLKNSEDKCRSATTR
jgi:hypothetical protein